MSGSAMASVLDVSSPLDLVRLTRRGVPATFLSDLATTLGVDRKAVAKILHIPERTLSRRIQQGANLTADEADRALRLARVIAFGIRMIGNREKAAAWLQTPNRALDGAVPVELLDTDFGTEAVTDVLGRIAYGVYS